MEYHKRPLDEPHGFNTAIPDEDAEKASNSYLMSLVALIAGMPIPIFNLLAGVIFYAGNRRGSYFVRWHCTQALVSQLVLFFFNSAGFWWTIGLLFFDESFSISYLVYIGVLLIVNLTEFLGTIYAAIGTRKGIDVRFFILSSITDMLCKNEQQDPHKQRLY